MKFKKVLIANRGEIAVRIIRACREAGIQCVTVYSTADRTALHAEIADQSVCIGPPNTKDSYLNMQALIAACEITGATALHPGFGFLSESAEFAALCREHDITFIGPSPESIAMLGDKARAKETMKQAGVPVIPGSDGAISSLEEAKEIAKRIGYPVLVKASAGGGGRGIRRIDREDQLEEQIEVAKEEAKKFFGNDEVYLEKLIVGPHHVEVQIIADAYGHVVALGERDCSMQRRNQKVLEESPSPLMTPELRQRMQQACSGSGDDPGEQEKPVDPPPSPDDGVDWSKIDPKATVRGVVTCAGAAVQGVVVTDGVNMTRTNKQGAYGLRTSSDKSKLVYLTVPSGYEVESTRGFIPRFYRRVTAPTSVEQMQRHDFTLKKVNNDRHIMIVSADMHIRNRAMIKTTSSATPSICPPKGELDSTTFRRTYLKALRDYVKALPAGVPVYGTRLNHQIS